MAPRAAKWPARWAGEKSSPRGPGGPLLVEERATNSGPADAQPGNPGTFFKGCQGVSDLSTLGTPLVGTRKGGLAHRLFLGYVARRLARYEHDSGVERQHIGQHVHSRPRQPCGLHPCRPQSFWPLGRWIAGDTVGSRPGSPPADSEHAAPATSLRDLSTSRDRRTDWCPRRRPEAGSRGGDAPDGQVSGRSGSPPADGGGEAQVRRTTTPAATKPPKPRRKPERPPRAPPGRRRNAGAGAEARKLIRTARPSASGRGRRRSDDRSRGGRGGCHRDEHPFGCFQGLTAKLRAPRESGRPRKRAARKGKKARGPRSESGHPARTHRVSRGRRSLRPGDERDGTRDHGRPIGQGARDLRSARARPGRSRSPTSATASSPTCTATARAAVSWSSPENRSAKKKPSPASKS